MEMAERMKKQRQIRKIHFYNEEKPYIVAKRGLNGSWNEKGRKHTERGIAINPKRQDLIKATKNSGLKIRNIEDIKNEIDDLVGAPLEKPDFTKDVIGVIKWVDGTVLDSIFKVK